jgi:hypothetical protein
MKLCLAAAKKKPKTRADSRIRTDDLIITNDLLYQLSYIGIFAFTSLRGAADYESVAHL